MPAFNYKQNDALWNVLRRHPAGITAKGAAAELHWTPVHASQRLGKLAMYDMIDRVPNPAGRSNEYRYQVRKYAHA